MTLSIVILPAKVLADGTHKIRIAFAHNGQTRYYNTRFIVPSTDCLKNGVIVKVGNASYINQQLRNLLTKLYKIYDEIGNSECYTCSQLLALIKSKLDKVVARSFEDIAKDWYQYKENKCSEGSLKSYRYGIANFTKFAGKNFILSTLDNRKVWEYDKWLSSFLSDTTVNIRMTVLIDIVNYSINRNYVKFEVNPFLEYKPHPKVIRYCSIPVAVVRKLRDTDFVKPHYNICRDVIMLSLYLAGINAADLLELDLTGDTITFSRKKTRNRKKSKYDTSFTIQPEARAIIDRYMVNGKLCFGTARTKEQLDTLLRYDRVLAQKIGYNGRLIYYSARKTFSQIGYLLGVQERVILYCIGDSSKSSNSMIDYYTFTDKKMADKAIRAILDFIASDKTEDDLFNQ